MRGLELRFFIFVFFWFKMESFFEDIGFVVKILMSLFNSSLGNVIEINFVILDL